MSQIYTITLQNMLKEIKKAIPQISDCFLYEKAGLLIKDDDSDESLIKNFVDLFDNLSQKVDSFDKLETITVKGANGQINTTSINDTYFTTVSSYEIDEKTLKILSTILIPTIINLLDQIAPRPAIPHSAQNEPSTISTQEITIAQEPVIPSSNTRITYKY